MPEDRLSHHEIRKHLAAAEEFIRAARREKPDDISDGSPVPRSNIQEHELEGALRKISRILDKLLQEQNGELSPLKSSLRLELARHENADRLLREREERLRLAFQAAGQGLYDLNVQTGDAVVSPEYAEMLGYDPATFVETNAAWIERLHPDDRAPVAAVYQNYISGKIPEYRVEFRQKTNNGGWKWILSLGKIVEYDSGGAPLRMLGTHTDITERKISEKTLHESELFKNAVLNGLSTHIAVLDEQGAILAVNDAWKEFAVNNGLSAGKVGPGANYLRICEDAHGPYSEQALPFAAGIRDVIAGRREMFEMEYPCDSPDEQRWFIGRVTRIRSEKEIRVIVAHEAITARKLAENARARAANEWQLTFDAVGSGISLLDADMRIVRVNKAVSQLLGRAPEELMGKHCWTVVHGSERPHEDCPTARMLVSRKQRAARSESAIAGSRSRRIPCLKQKPG